MSATRPAPLTPSGAATGPTTTKAAAVAKAALRRLALAQQEPTPENYARAYDEELGLAARPVLPARAQAQFERLVAAALPEEGPRAALLAAFAGGQSTQVERLLDAHVVRAGASPDGLAVLLERLVRGLERSNRQWTLARRKESVQSVIAGSRADAGRLQQRVSQLVASWDADGAGAAEPTAAAPLGPPELPAVRTDSKPAPTGAPVETLEALASVGAGLLQSLPGDDPRAERIGGTIEASLARVAQDDASPVLLAELRRGVAEAVRLQQRRHGLLGHLRTLCGELTAALTELAEDGSWARGQCEAMQAKLDDDGLAHARGVRSVSALLCASSATARATGSSR